MLQWNLPSYPKNMGKGVSGVLSLFFTFFVFSAVGSTNQAPPHQLKTFKPRFIQNGRSCSYTVIIKTSCSSTPYTRDRVSLAFGDVNGNEVYVKKLDDPYSGTFEKCSADRFEIRGPCVPDICYLYLLRRGSDGWKPESVKVYGRYTRAVNFYFNKFLPNGVWFGFNACNGLLKSS